MASLFYNLSSESSKYSELSEEDLIELFPDLSYDPIDSDLDDDDGPDLVAPAEVDNTSQNTSQNTSKNTLPKHTIGARMLAVYMLSKGVYFKEVIDAIGIGKSRIYELRTEAI
jgi:hypothetical protein